MADHSYDLPDSDDSTVAARVTRSSRSTRSSCPVQVNGKLRDRIEAPADISEEAAKELALASEKVKAYMDGKEIRKAIYVPGRLVNLVVG